MKIVGKTFCFITVFLTSLVILMAFAASVSAHGYVSSPESRGLLCAQGVNEDCGGVMYEPQSLEGPGNFPVGGPADGEIAGANVFPKLNEQTEHRWTKVPMESGAYTFEWTLTAAHASDNWDYYITRETWNPNAPLTRADLELFCSYDDNGARPPFTVTHHCVIPERSGYHIILAYWEVADTPMGFYNVIDVNFSGGHVEPDPNEPVDPPGDGGEDGDIQQWQSNAVYVNGDLVRYEGVIYIARWWTQNDIPGQSAVWSVYSTEDDKDEPDDYPIWDPNHIYVSGDRVLHNTSVYEALWWTLGEEPGNSSVWIRIE
ncbi:lytic polysaccharide monooxygenase [Alkalihalobacterium bogoriense]|uniref:lytic polysaccharide monooxygenase n=1 Tax=Alkalihalobacterium bogoriense TaxID=246272 RepID=UPI0004794057|nr:lytic polysaccharide monooxygenase [Alkalihalobacterium bogoriense]